MKKINLLCLLSLLSWFANAQIQVISSGNVGVGTNASSTYKFNLSGSSYFGGGVTYINDGLMLSTAISGPTSFVTANSSFPGLVLTTGSSYSSTYLLWVGGDAYSSGSWISSDLELKKNMTMLDGEQMLSKIKNLDGKKYEFKSNEELEQLYKNGGFEKDKFYKLSNLPKETRYGLIAQEVEQVFPELVKTDTITGLKAIDYNGMIPVLLQCIKEQQKRIESLEKSINEENITINKQNVPNKNISSKIASKTEIDNSLYQNAPNPFNQSTVIEYCLKENVSNALICIYNMNGTQLKSIKISEVGLGRITINSKDLKPGMYFYSLITDGNLVDTKRLVLIE